jgi:hypothetical protein
MCHLSICLSIYLWLYSPCGPWPLLQFLNLYTVGRTPWTGDRPVARPLPTHRATQTHNKHTQTSMSRVGFEPTIPVFERAKTLHALDSAAAMIGYVASALTYYDSVFCPQRAFAFRVVFTINSDCFLKTALTIWSL